MRPTRISRAGAPAALAILLVIVILACGCTQQATPPAATPAPTAATAAPTAPAETPRQTTAPSTAAGTYESARYGFAIAYPAGWAVQENTGGAAVVFTAPAQGTKDLFLENLRVTVTDLSANPQSLDQFADAGITAKKYSIQNYNPIYDERPKVGGYNARKIAYTGMMGSGLGEWVDLYVVKGTTGYVVSFSSEEKNYNIYVPDTKKMYDSFKFTS